MLLLRSHCIILSLKECIWLDSIQKHKPITDDAIKTLGDIPAESGICNFSENIPRTIAEFKS
jgi:hypothetical protein